MSLLANVKFFPKPTGELYGWLLATLFFNNVYYSDCDRNIIVNQVSSKGSTSLSGCKNVLGQEYKSELFESNYI